MGPGILWTRTTLSFHWWSIAGVESNSTSTDLPFLVSIFHREFQISVLYEWHVPSDTFPAGATGSSDMSWNNWSFDPPSLNTVVTSSSSSPPSSYNAAHAADNDNKSLWSYSGNNTSAWSNTPAQPTLRPPMEVSSHLTTVHFKIVVFVKKKHS